METAVTPRRIGDEGRKVASRPLQYHGYIWDKVWAKVDQISNNENPSRNAHADHIAELTVSMKCHQLDTGTGKMSIILFPAVNTSVTEK